MPQTVEGLKKAAAKRIGVSLQEYSERTARGEKWCSRGKHWVRLDLFQKDRSRYDGRQASCFACGYKPVRKTGPGKRQRAAMLAKELFWCRVCVAWLDLSNKAVGDSTCRLHRNALDRLWYQQGGKIKKAPRIHARKRNIEPVPIDLQQSLTALFEGLCAYCGTRSANTWDHIVPVHRGGQSVIGNILPACHNCNSSKGTKNLELWMREKQLSGHPKLNLVHF